MLVKAKRWQLVSRDYKFMDNLMIATLRYIRLHVIPIIVWINYLNQSNVFMIWYYEHEVTITRCRSLSFRSSWTHLLIVLSLLLYKWHNVLVYKWHNVLVYMVKFKCYVNRIGERGWAFVSVNKRYTYLLTYLLVVGVVVVISDDDDVVVGVGGRVSVRVVT